MTKKYIFKAFSNYDEFSNITIKGYPLVIEWCWLVKPMWLGLKFSKIMKWCQKSSKL